MTDKLFPTDTLAPWVAAWDLIPLADVSDSNALIEWTVQEVFNAWLSGASAIDAAKIADWSVSNTEFQYLNGVTSAIQTQLAAKAASSHTHTASEITDFNTSADSRIWAASINALSDVVITGASNWQVLKYNGTNWINDTDATGGGGVSDGDKWDITISGSGATYTIDNDVVTYAKMQNVSATDKLLGRSTSGAGDIEEIACTAAWRALLDDADAAAQRTTLWLAIWTNVQAYDADLTAWAGKTAPSGTAVWTSDSQTLTTKTIALGSNTITWTKAEFDTACTDGNFAYQSDLASYQPLDADLTALAALTWTDTIYYRSAANTWTAVTIGSGLSFSTGTLAASGGWGSSFRTTVPWTPTRTSDTVFTITDTSNANLYNQLLQRWTILKRTQSGVKQAMVVSATYASNTVTVTIIGDTLSSGFSDMKYWNEKARSYKFAIAWTIWNTWSDFANKQMVEYPVKIYGCDVRAWTAWSWTTTFDINKGWTTMFTTKPSITTTNQNILGVTADTGTTATTWDYLTVDVDAVAGTTKIIDAYINLYYIPLYTANLT